MKGAAIKLMFAAILASAVSCNRGSKDATQTRASTKRYHLAGTVVSVDKRAHMVNVDGQEIPGFMSAMTMPYTVKPENELDELSPGDSISADVVVQGESSWLENVSVTKAGTAQQK